MYERITWKFDDSWEIKVRHTARYGAPGEKRKKRKKPTPEQMRENNQRNRIEKYRRLIKWNFVPEEDYWITFTYRPEERPEDRKQAQKHMENFRRCLRRRFKKTGTEMKWICITEIGSKGAVHHHMILNRIEGLDTMITKMWKHGHVSIKLLYKDGDFQGLAKYLCKESRVSPSRNLIEKDPEVQVMKRGTWPEEIKVPKGFYLDKNSVREGINLFGFRYRHYIIVKAESKENGKCRDIHRSRQKGTKRDHKMRGVSPGDDKARKSVCSRRNHEN